MESDLNKIIGAKILAVEGASVGSYSVTFRTDKGDLRLYFDNDYWGPCHVDVCVEDITGDPADMIDGTVYVAEERSNNRDDGGGRRTRWTFYTIRTSKGDLDLRWLGKDNGHYSIAVRTDWTEKEEEEELDEAEKEWREFMERQWQMRLQNRK